MFGGVKLGRDGRVQGIASHEVFGRGPDFFIVGSPPAAAKAYLSFMRGSLH